MVHTSLVSISYWHRLQNGWKMEFEYNNTQVILDDIFLTLCTLLIIVLRPIAGFPVPSLIIAVKLVEPFLKSLRDMIEGESWYGRKADLCLKKY